MDFAALDEREGDYTWRSNLFDGDQVKKIHPPQGLDGSAIDNEYRNLVNVRHIKSIVGLTRYCYELRNDYVKHNVEPVMATVWERMLCFEYVKGGGLNKHIQDESCDLEWEPRYKIIKGGCEDINHLHSAQDHFAKPVRESMGKLIDEFIAAHDKNRARQPLSVLGVYGFGGAGKTSLTRHLFQDFHSPRMFQNIDSKTLLRSIFDRVRQQSLNASIASDQSVKRNIKDSIDFVLGIHKQKTIRENGIDMDILRCTVEALAEECNQFSVGLDIRPTTFRSLICTEMCGKYMHTHIRPVQKPQSMKDLGTEGVNFSVTDSSLQNGDVSGRIRCPEVDRSFCSPPWVLDSGASVSPTGGFNLLGFHRVVAMIIVSLVSDCSRTAMNTRHWLRKSRHNKGCRVVSRRYLCQKTRYHKRGDTRAAFQTNQGLVSRSEPVAADNSRLLTPDSTPERAWRVASAAPQHMTGYLNHLTDYTPASGDQVIDTPTMGPMVFHGRGSVNTKNMNLRDVLYVPGLEANLVSTGQLAELGYTIAIGPYGCRVYRDDEGMDLVGKAHYVDGYLLELDFLRV